MPEERGFWESNYLLSKDFVLAECPTARSRFERAGRYKRLQHLHRPMAKHRPESVVRRVLGKDEETRRPSTGERACFGCDPLRLEPLQQTAGVLFWPVAASKCLVTDAMIRPITTSAQGSSGSCLSRRAPQPQKAVWVFLDRLQWLGRLHHWGPKRAGIPRRESRAWGLTNWDLLRPSMLWLSAGRDTLRT